MSQAESPLADLLARVRAGDQAAVFELVARYETNIRVAVRTRLTDPALRRQFDSMDVCQSVFQSFFVRVGLGQYDLANPADLVALLVRMAHNKVVSRVRYHRRERRDYRRDEADGADHLDREAGGHDPAREAAMRDLLDRVRAALTDDERAVADLRGKGYSWPEVAERLGGTAEARRKQLDRAIDRVAADLGLDEDSTYGAGTGGSAG